MTSTAIIVDSACSLPPAVCEKYKVSYAPLSYTVNGETRTDPCDPVHSVSLFRSGNLGKKCEVYTSPPTPEDFEQAIRKRIDEGYDRVVVQTLNRTQGDTYNNANTGVARVNQSLPDKTISVRVMDSRTVFAGQGLMAVETIRRLLREKSHDEVRRKMDLLSEKIHTFIIPRDIVVARQRAMTRNENSVGWAQARIADTLGIYPLICNVNDSSSAIKKIRGFDNAARDLFAHTAERIKMGLYSPIVTVCYVGPLEELKALPGYSELAQVAAANKIMLIPSVASIASGVYTSPGSLSVAMATDPHEWD